MLLVSAHLWILRHAEQYLLISMHFTALNMKMVWRETAYSIFWKYHCEVKLFVFVTSKISAKLIKEENCENRRRWKNRTMIFFQSFSFLNWSQIHSRCITCCWLHHYISPLSTDPQCVPWSDKTQTKEETFSVSEIISHFSILKGHNIYLIISCKTIHLRITQQIPHSTSPPSSFTVELKSHSSLMSINTYNKYKYGLLKGNVDLSDIFLLHNKDLCLSPPRCILYVCLSDARVPQER